MIFLIPPNALIRASLPASLHSLLVRIARLPGDSSLLSKLSEYFETEIILFFYILIYSLRWSLLGKDRVVVAIRDLGLRFFQTANFSCRSVCIGRSFSRFCAAPVHRFQGILNFAFSHCLGGWDC
jgi:hypothetical protein